MRAKRVVIWLAFILALLILLLGGLWYGRLRTAGGKASDSSYGLIASPLSGDVVFVGNPVYVAASFLLSHRNLASLQLYVDGAKYVLDKQTQPYANQAVPKCSSNDAKFCGPIDARMLWIPMNAGAHVLSACISSDGSQGSAWTVCTDAANVIVADLKTPPETAGTYLPQAGDTLESIAHKFGLPPLLVVADNPGIKPVAELPGEIPVNIPIDPSLIEPPRASGSPLILDKVTMTIDLAVDKVYCYYSPGENDWSRLPIEPQTFVYPSNGRLDLTAEFRSLPIPPGGSLDLECWGWRGSNLIPLGSGKTNVGSAASNDIQVRGEHFMLDVSLKLIPGTLEPRDIKYIIPPPQGLTSTSLLDVCIKHFPPADFFFGPFACKTAVENSDIILIWDWLVPIFPPDDPTVSYVTKIDGYHVYEVNSVGKPSLIATVSISDKKVLILKRTWIGLGDFMVRAYAGPLESANSNLYTMSGTTSGLATVTIDPTFIHYGGGIKKKESGGCSVALGGASIVGDPSIDEFAVGYSHWWPEDSCLTYYEEYSRAYSSFDLSSVKGPVSSATLSYRQGFSSVAGVPISPSGGLTGTRSCARDLGVVTKDPSYDLYESLPSLGYTGAVFKVDATSAVRDWMSGTPNNGFLFVGSDESLPADCGGFGEGCIGGGTESCWTSYGNLLLTVTYFVK